MDLLKEKYIILELIPSHSNSEKGIIIQLQALKLDGIKLIDRFDYRVSESLIENNDLLNLISYDNEMFNYVDDSKLILEKFNVWSENLPILIIDNNYTPAYLKDILNKKESVFNYLNMEFNDDVFSILMEKYDLEFSNHLVDLLYEAIIKESNFK